MAYTEVLTSGNSATNTAEKWDVACHQEYVGKLMMKWLMGSSDDAVLQVKENLTKGAGDAVTIHFAGAQEGGTVRGNAKGIGNEGRMDFYAQRFVIDNTRNLHKIWDLPMSQQRLTFDILTQMKHALSTKHAEVLDDDVVLGLTDTSVGRVRGRYLYGAADSNWDATHATALSTNVDSTDDKLTTDILSIAKRKATIKGVGVSEKIRPTKIKNGMRYEDWFIFLGHTYAIRDLTRDDAAFRNQQLLLTPGRNSDSVYFTGSHFKGSWGGVLIYEYDRLPLGPTAGVNSIQTAHNLLLGAQAGAIVWGQRTRYTDEDEDLKHNYIAEFHDIRNKNGGAAGSYNIKMIRNSVDHGLINVFTSAVAD